jgi:actin-related protein 6
MMKGAASPSVLVVDNGAWEFRWGWSGDAEPRSTPNCLVKEKAAKGAAKKRVLVGEDTREAREAGTVYRRPCERGCVVDWSLEKRLWDAAGLSAQVDGASLLVTVPPRVPGRVGADLVEVCFEELGAASLSLMAATTAAGWSASGGRGSSLVVEAGYSQSHVQLVLEGRSGPVGRLDAGGKALTNYLKEMVSYRQWNMMDETWLVNRVKERLALVPATLEEELTALARGDVRARARSYVLPDYVTSRTGWVREEDAAPDPPPLAGTEQVLRMGPERLALGEALFRPSDLGLPQMGLGEGALQLLHAASPAHAAACAARVILAGGTAQMRGFGERVLAELRMGVPDDVPVRLAATQCPSPAQAAWRGAAAFARSLDYAPTRVTRREYDEFGAELSRKRDAPYM